MAESVIFNSPELLFGFIAALGFCILGFKKPSSGYLFPVLSVVLCVAMSVCALLNGASLYELSTVILVFLALNLTSYFKHKGDGQ